MLTEDRTLLLACIGGSILTFNVGCVLSQLPDYDLIAGFPHSEDVPWLSTYRMDSDRNGETSLAVPDQIVQEKGSVLKWCGVNIPNYHSGLLRALWAARCFSWRRKRQRIIGRQWENRVVPHIKTASEDDSHWGKMGIGARWTSKITVRHRR